MPEFKDLTAITGRIVREPTQKAVGEDDVMEFKISQQLSYKGGTPDKNGKDWGVTRLVTVTVWNAQLQQAILDEGLIKGQTVACEGVMKREQGEYADFTAYRVGQVAFIAKAGAKAKRPADDDSF